MKNQHHKLTIVGGGPVGSLLAINLAERGFSPVVYERRPDPRAAGHVEGRSINLALSTRGLKALESIGLKQAMLDIATPMKGRMMHAVDGSTSFQRYGKDDSEVIYAVSRGELSNTLTKMAAEKTGVEFHFMQECAEIDFREHKVEFKDRKSHERHSITTDVIIGSDGANSAVRHELAKLPRFSTCQEYIDYGYKELSIPAGTNDSFQIEQNALHIWPRGNYMLIALPNYDGSFTCTLFFPYEGEVSFASIKTPSDVEQLFSRQFPDAKALIPDLSKAFFENPTGALASIHCNPWHWEDFAVLVGDAAHGMVPFLGQGLNCAFESAMILLDSIDNHPDNWEAAFVEFTQRRRDDADAIIDMALENFIEMRDKVADARFLLNKKVELELERRFSDRYLNRYGMIQFHGSSYAEAMRRGVINDQITEELLTGVDDIAKVDWQLADILINQLEV